MEEHPIKVYRMRHAMTLDQLATKAGTTKSTLSRVERGELRPTMELLRRLSAATGITADDIIAGIPEPAQAAEMTDTLPPDPGVHAA